MKKEEPGFKKRIGFLGGTFDPIHFGHLTLAIEMQEKKDLDAIYFCPTYLSPFKKEAPPLASDFHRLQMVQLAIQNIPSFSVLDIELKRGAITYTVDTLEELMQKEREEFFLILAEDVASSLDRWKEVKKLLTLAPLLVGVHSDWNKEGIAHLPSFIQSAIEKGTVPISTIEISSTLIRDRFKKNLYCGHLLPEKVLDYIYANRLY